MAVTNIESTQLDFQQIKQRLKTYLASDNEFQDYNFEASGLSNILDVLAYNTHFNGLIANFALNEAFLNTAQLRSSIVSHAQGLGYSPRSKTSSQTNVNLTLNLAGVSNRNTTYILPAFTLFTTSINDITYTFQTTESLTATDNGSGLYEFSDVNGNKNVILFEGTKRTKKFYVGKVGERQIYVIPDSTMDTATTIVKVFANPSTTEFEAYTPISKAIRVDQNSKFYQITEAPNGFYELNFGDGISFGQAPETGTVVQVEYLSTVGADANGGQVFSPSSQYTVNGQGYDLSVTTVSNSTSGSDRQTVESIRSNAPLAFAAQQRLVTAEDYKAIILANYSNIVDAIAWGGEDNIPANYGNVYVGLKFQDGITEAEKTSTKDSITSNITDFLSVLSIGTIYVDPIETFIEAVVEFNFDPNLTSVTLQSTESVVYSKVRQFFESNLGLFGSIFRRSNLLTTVDQLEDSVINSSVAIKVQQRFEPILNQSLSYEINFPVTLQAPDDIIETVTSSTFRFNNKVCLIKNKLNSKKLVITDTLGNVEVDNLGQYDPDRGKVELNGFIPESITSGQTYIKLSVTPRDQSVIKPLRNYILLLDTDASFASGKVDRQTVDVTL